MSNTPKPSHHGQYVAPYRRPLTPWEARGGVAGFLTLVLLVCLTVAGMAAPFVVSCASMPANKIIDGAKVVLAGLCETLPTPQLDLARQQLDRNDLESAAQHLRDELKAHGHQPDVAALLALIETQIPPPEPAP